MILRKYLIYFSNQGWGIRWPVSWDFPGPVERLCMVMALLWTIAAIIACIRCALR